MTNNAVAGAARGPDEIQTHHRAVALGMTGTGKSQILLGLLADDPGQRLLIDVNDAYILGQAVLSDEGGYQEVSDPRQIDWSLRTIRIVPPVAGRGARPWYEDLYAAIWDRGEHFQQLGHLSVLLDESFGPTTANYAPDMLVLVQTQGRKRKLRHYAAQQRPADVEPTLLASSEHAFVFDVGARPDDHDTIGRRLGWTGKDVAHAIQELHDKYGFEDPTTGEFKCHGYLRHRLGRREVHELAPLPKEIIDRTNTHFINAT